MSPKERETYKVGTEVRVLPTEITVLKPLQGLVGVVVAQGRNVCEVALKNVPSNVPGERFPFRLDEIELVVVLETPEPQRRRKRLKPTLNPEVSRRRRPKPTM
jgi:hypothetical protein